MMNYAEIADIRAIRHSLTEAQHEAAEKLIEYASARLRVIAHKVGRDIDTYIADPVTGTDYTLAVKFAVVQSVCRALDNIDSRAGAISQGSETVGAYSVSMTYYNPGQICYFTRNELKDLGLLCQTYGALEMYKRE